MGSPMIVLVLPAPQLGGELRDGAEGRTAIELLAIGAMAALDFSVVLRASRRNVAMGDAIPGMSPAALEESQERAAVGDNGDGGSRPRS